MSNSQSLYTLHVCSLNIWHGELADALIAYLAERTPRLDMFCFQEIDGEIYTKLKQFLRDDYTVHYVEKTGEHRIHNATFISKRLHVIETRGLLGTAEYAGLGLLSLVGYGDDAQIAVVNVHGVSQPGDKLDTPGRTQQTRLLLEIAAQYPHTPVVFAGDFNLLPHTESIDMFRRHGWRDLIQEYQIPTTRNHYAWDRFPGSKQLFADYCFVPNDSVAVEAFKVRQDAIVSDHLPLEVVLRF